MDFDLLTFVSINTISTTYTAGEAISGEIYLKLSESIKSSSIILKFSGFEYSIVKKFHTPYKETHEIINNETILHNWPLDFAIKNDYVFHFEILTPDDLPGSTHIDLNDVKAVIEYKLIVIVSEFLTSSVDIHIRPNIETYERITEIAQKVNIRS